MVGWKGRKIKKTESLDFWSRLPAFGLLDGSRWSLARYVTVVNGAHDNADNSHTNTSD